MARPRKPLENQNGHLTVNFQEARARAEGKMKPSTNDLLKKRSKDLIDSNARKMWDILTPYLLKIAFYGDINIADVVGYCNAYSAYLSAWKQYKLSETLDSKDYCMNLVKKASEEMTRCQNRAGFSASSRIQIGDKEAQKEEKDINETFGDI